jgi:hypothetical protein
VVEIRDAQGNRVTSSAAVVTLALQSGAGGTLGGTLSATAVSGVATFSGVTLAGTVGTNYVLRATATGLDLVDSNNVTVTAGAASRLVVTGRDTMTAGATQTITITARDANGNTATGYAGDKTLTFTGASAASTGETPTVSDKNSVATSFASAATVTFTAGVATSVMTLFKAETAVVAVTDGTLSATLGDRLSVTVSAAGFNSAQSTVAVNPTSVVANGTSSSTVTVQVEDAYGNVTNSGVTSVTATISNSASLSAFTHQGTGRYTASATSTVAGAAVVDASINSGSITNASNNSTTSTITFTPGAASLAQSTIVTSASQLPNDGVTTATITVRLKDANGNNLTASGGTVTLSKTGPGTLSAVTDNSNGTYTATISSGVAGTAVISASLGGSALTNASNPVSVAFAAALYSVTVSNTTPVIGTAITVTAQAQNASGDNLAHAGHTVTWTRTGGGTLSAATSTTDANGRATVTFTVNSTALTSHRVTATDNATPSLTGTSDEFITQPVPTQYVVTASNSNAAVGETITISAQLAGSTGQAVSIANRTVTWSSTTSNLAGSFSAATSVTNAAGIATVSFTVSSDGGGTHTVKASDESGAITGTTSPTGASGSPITGTSEAINVGISLVNASPVVPGNANSTSVTLRTPAGLRVGDLMIAVLALSVQSGDISTNTISTSSNWPSGWALLDGMDFSNVAAEKRQLVFYKWVTSINDANQEVSWSYSSARVAGIVLAYRNVDQTTPVDVKRMTNGDVASNQMTIPSVTTTRTNGRVISLYTHASGNGQIYSAGTGNALIYRYDSQGANGTGTQSGGAYTSFMGQQRYQVTVGAVGGVSGNSNLTGAFTGILFVLGHR